MMPDPYAWATEFECQFADSASQLVSISDLEFVNYSTDRKFSEYFIGADWARNSDGTSIAVFGRSTDGKLCLVELVNLHRVEYAKQIAVAKNLFQKYRPKLFYGDATGLGGPLMEQLNRECSPLIKPFVFNHNNKNQAYEYFRRCVFDRKIQFNEEYRDAIVEDLLLVQQTITDDGKVVYVARRSNNSHADNISAIILALQAERECRQGTGQIAAVNFNSVFGNSTSYFG
jgi:phage FluMu gp28-like protein